MYNEVPLAKSSRINYTKIHSLEHNSLVTFVGEIHQEDFPLLRDRVFELMFTFSGARRDEKHAKSSKRRSKRDKGKEKEEEEASLTEEKRVGEKSQS